MARRQRRRTVREGESAQATSPVQLREARRFYSARGSDQPSRTARALTQAFASGTDLAGTLLDKRNVEGAKQAAFEEATGAERDEDSRVKGYVDKWDELQAENDMVLLRDRVTETLRQNDWENLPQGDVQAIIDGVFEDELKGADPQSLYSQNMARGIQDLNVELLGTHSNWQLENLRQEQRSMISNTALESYEATGEYPYDVVADRTNTFFDGPDKKAAFIEIIGQAAIDAADENLILNMPTHFRKSGDPTGIDDPRFRGEHIEPYISKARARREAMEKKEAAAAKAAREERAEDAKRDMMEQALQGVDPTATALEYLDMGIVEDSDVTSAISNFRTSRDDRAQQGADFQKIAAISSTLNANPNSLSNDDLWGFYSEGVFGPPDSDEAVGRFRGMMSERESNMSRAASVAKDPNKQMLVDRFEQFFPKAGSLMAGFEETPQAKLRADYLYSLRSQLADAGSREDQMKIYDEHVDRYEKAKTLLEGQEASTSPIKTFNQVMRGNFTPEQAAAHMRVQGWTATELINASHAGEIDTAPGTPGGDAYRLMLEELNK